MRAEFTLSCLTYNLRRVLNLVALADLLAAVGTAGPPTPGVGA